MRHAPIIGKNFPENRSSKDSQKDQCCKKTKIRKNEAQEEANLQAYKWNKNSMQLSLPNK